MPRFIAVNSDDDMRIGALRGLTRIAQNKRVGAGLLQAKSFVAHFKKKLDGRRVAVTPLHSHMINPDLIRRAKEYGVGREVEINFADPLGSGTDGAVWATGGRTAIKALERQKNYTQELACYKILAENRIKDLLGFNIPSLIDFDDTLWIIELSIVRPPFILDFAKSYIGAKPVYSAEIDEEEELRCLECFGEHRWPKVRLLLYALQRYEIYYVDAKPGNIMFES